jgi:hypothetical protein
MLLIPALEAALPLCSKRPRCASSLRPMRGTSAIRSRKPTTTSSCVMRVAKLPAKTMGVRIVVKDPAVDGEPLSSQDEAEVGKTAACARSGE